MMAIVGIFILFHDLVDIFTIKPDVSLFIYQFLLFHL